MSITVAVARGAQEGVLVKNAEALERLEKVTTLVVDKTGTLTEGKPRLMDAVTNDGFDQNELLRLVASLEQSSEHPLAAAIVAGAKAKSVSLEPATNFRSTTGGGVFGRVANKRRVGRQPEFSPQRRSDRLQRVTIQSGTTSANRTDRHLCRRGGKCCGFACSR